MLPKISIYYHIFLQFKGKTCNDEWMEEIKIQQLSVASDTKGESGNLYTLGVFILLLQLQTETIHSWKLKVKATAVHGILQARIPEWVAFPFSRGSSQPRDRTQVSHIAGGFFTSSATWEAPEN